MWYVYFLQLSNGYIYVGSTNDLRRRFASHQAGQVLSTKSHLPATLKSYVAVETEEHARELEELFQIRFRKGDSSQKARKKRYSGRLIVDVVLRFVVLCPPFAADG